MCAGVGRWGGSAPAHIQFKQNIGQYSITILIICQHGKVHIAQHRYIICLHSENKSQIIIPFASATPQMSMSMSSSMSMASISAMSSMLIPIYYSPSPCSLACSCPSSNCSCSFSSSTQWNLGTHCCCFSPCCSLYLSLALMACSRSKPFTLCLTSPASLPTTSPISALATTMPMCRRSRWASQSASTLTPGPRSSSSTPSMASSSAPTRPSSSSPTVLDMTSWLLVSSSYLTAEWSRVVRAWLRMVVMVSRGLGVRSGASGKIYAGAGEGWGSAGRGCRNWFRTTALRMLSTVLPSIQLQTHHDLTIYRPQIPLQNTARPYHHIATVTVTHKIITSSNPRYCHCYHCCCCRPWSAPPPGRRRR